MTIESAHAHGYTRKLLLDGDTMTLEVMVKPDADLGDRFAAFDLDNQEMIQINGWLFTAHEE